MKGARRLGVRIGNWITVEEGKRLLGAYGTSTSRLLRDRAMMAVLIGCALRRAEAAALRIGDIQMREGHWIIADLKGKSGHVRTVPVPDWVKTKIDPWTSSRGYPAEYNFGRSIRLVECGEMASLPKLSGPL